MQRVFTFVLLTALLGCGSSQESAPQPEERSTPKVLLIGVDGVRPDVMAQVSTPNIDALAAEGSFTSTAQNVLPTVSGPCWSSMLIGAGPDKHGVLGNDFSSNHYADYPDFLTRIERVRPELGTFAAVDWLPLGDETDGGPLLGDELDRKVVLDGYQFGWPEADSISVEATINELESGDSDALFVYLGNPDVASHDAGSVGEEYRESIATADRHVGRLVAAIKGRGTYAQEDWLILVATDHGRTDQGGHGGETPEETTIFFLASGPSAQVGTPEGPVSIMDVPVTAMAHLGIELDPAWDLDGKVVGLKR